MSFRDSTKGLLVATLALTVCACQAGIIDNGGDADSLAGDGNGPGNASVNFTTATHPDLLQIIGGNGSVLRAPTLQIVTFNNDTNASQLADFATQLAVSAYWKAATSEYGVGALTVATPRQATYAWPTNTTDGDILSGQSSDVENYLVSQLDGASPAWGAPNANTIYMLFMPAGITVSPDGGQTKSACAADILAWHTAVKLPQSGVTINYVVQPNCGSLTGLSLIDSRTFAASHEIITTATNPHLDGYGALDHNHAYWGLVTGSVDVASACVAQQNGGASVATKPADISYTVQRTWSNARAKAGHAPCVPADANEVFFDAVPVLDTVLSASVSTNDLVAPVNTLGIKIAKGTAGTVELDLFSDGYLADGWHVSATEVGTSDLTFGLNETTGNNGDILQLRITVASAPKDAQQLVRIASVSGAVTNTEYILVHN